MRTVKAPPSQGHQGGRMEEVLRIAKSDKTERGVGQRPGSGGLSERSLLQLEGGAVEVVVAPGHP